MRRVKVNAIYKNWVVIEKVVENNQKGLKKIYSDFDGMELHLDDGYEILRCSDVFSTWRSDSICVWNPEVVIPV